MPMSRRRFSSALLVGTSRRRFSSALLAISLTLMAPRPSADLRVRQSGIMDETFRLLVWDHCEEHKKLCERLFPPILEDDVLRMFLAGSPCVDACLTLK